MRPNLPITDLDTHQMDNPNTQVDHPPSGGFLPPTPSSLQSPAPSSTSVPTSSNRFLTDLPHPRRNGIRPSKEDMVRDYASSKLMLIARRFVKKFSNPSPDSEVIGYHNFAEMCTDYDSLINVLWLSGTPSLQVPFLLRVASELSEYILSFPPAPKATVKLLRKLDHCFASLARGKDLATGEDLPGLHSGLNSGMTTTDLVRCRSTAESTRDLMFNVLGDDPEDDDEGDQDLSGVDLDVDVDRGGTSEVDKIYENTLVSIGERLGGDVELGAGS